MSKEPFVRRLRPHLFIGFNQSQCLPRARGFAVYPKLRQNSKERDVTHDYEKRLAHIQEHKPLKECYPRLPQSVSRNRLKDADELSHECTGFERGETDTDRVIAVAGRVRAIRIMGKKVIFMDLLCGDGKIQASMQLNNLREANPNLTEDDMTSFARILRPGDIYSVTGHPHRTPKGEKSVLATEMPTLLSPSLHQHLFRLDDPETRTRSRHLEMLANPEAVQTLRVRHEVESMLQDFLNDRGFIKVNTPILSAGAGGALARPFETEATEFAGQKLNLRVAPELWLKRLVVGGLDRVYEIGPAFRNEGVDGTHNPEFQICEFYQAYTTLQDLIQMTKDLISHLKSIDRTHLGALPQIDLRLNEHFEEVEFIPRLEKEMSLALPDLESPDAIQHVLGLFESKQKAIPSNPTLPRLLDALAEIYLEPLSQTHPIFITNHPACMSPLSKHFVCPKTHQTVAARAELFIAGREYANMYEEENDPFEQRRKFVEQLRMREVDGDAEAMEVDEDYLRVLEWGMPPTGGWGCGIDRLVMLLAGRERISDVLAFGSLRNVVGLGRKR